MKAIDIATYTKDNESITNSYPSVNLATENSANGIPFNKLYTTDQELEYIAQAIASGSTVADCDAVPESVFSKP